MPQNTETPHPSPARATRRWLTLAAFWIAEAIVIYVLAVAWAAAADSGLHDPIPYVFSAANFVRLLGDAYFSLWVFLTISVIIVLQGIMLFPFARAPPVGEGGTSLWLTFAAAGLAIAGLWTAAILALTDLVWLVFDQNLMDWHWAMTFFIGVQLVGWGAATPLLIVFCRHGGRETVLGRIAARLFLGTVVETVAIIPLDVMVRRKTECYCGQGTFWALTICGTVGAFSMGPAILLPLLARRRKRWYSGRCDCCGYDMSGLPTADRCPECGAGWRAAK